MKVESNNFVGCSSRSALASPRRLSVISAFGIAMIGLGALTMLHRPSDARSSASNTNGGGIALQPRMGDPLDGLSSDHLSRWLIGRSEFERNITVEEGLGPIFNQTSCASCHNNPVGGSGAQTVTRFGAIGKKGDFDPLDALGGSLLQSESIAGGCEEIIPPESNHSSLRVTNSSMAFGLVESIPESDLLANESVVPPITGRAHMVAALEDPPGSPLRVGRFGWKAQVPTVLSFSADAAKNELGFTNRLDDTESAPNGNAALLAACDTVPDPEDGPDGEGFHFIDRVTDFQRFLAPPPQTPKSGMVGEALFNAVGCNSCHVSSFTTSNDPTIEDVLRNKPLHPYSDFLLHDMGTLGDGIEQGDATGREIRTPPLWGVRVRDPLLHDGRVAGGTFDSRMLQVVQHHDVFGSEARPSAQAFLALTPSEQQSIYAFLDSLGRAEFDANGDNAVNVSDYVDLKGCYGLVGVSPDDPCAVHDINQDGDIDATDSAWFMAAWDGLRRDCDNNGVMDLQDILDGVLADADDNAIADSCQPTCDVDTNGNGSADVLDLLAVLTSWGPCEDPPAPCKGDLNGDDSVGILDLLKLLGDWGRCP